MKLQIRYDNGDDWSCWYDASDFDEFDRAAEAAFRSSPQTVKITLHTAHDKYQYRRADG